MFALNPSISIMLLKGLVVGPELALTNPLTYPAHLNNRISNDSGGTPSNASPPIFRL
ncbi:MAG: hypothetical protein LCI00_29545 [Chloroflexi bacterium]|nr:hypothetical protein [Chloroflexota bacterium]MCC6893654.1 hypothetical protein [Anaerolineae bacterium]